MTQKKNSLSFFRALFTLLLFSFFAMTIGFVIYSLCNATPIDLPQILKAYGIENSSVFYLLVVFYSTFLKRFAEFLASLFLPVKFWVVEKFIWLKLVFAEIGASIRDSPFFETPGKFIWDKITLVIGFLWPVFQYIAELFGYPSSEKDETPKPPKSSK
jgi:hypothetical protein